MDTKQYGNTSEVLGTFLDYKPGFEGRTLDYETGVAMIQDLIQDRYKRYFGFAPEEGLWSRPFQCLAKLSLLCKNMAKGTVDDNEDDSESLLACYDEGSVGLEEAFEGELEELGQSSLRGWRFVSG